MSEASTIQHGKQDSAGRHRGAASAEENDRNQAPHGRHRRTDEG